MTGLSSTKSVAILRISLTKMDNEEVIHKLEERVDTLEKELARYRGFVGGVVFIITSIWAFIELAGPWLTSVLKKLS
jgi:hypothetical protein